MATVLAVVMCRGCKVQVFDDGTILRIDEPASAQQITYGIAASKVRANGTTWADTWQNAGSKPAAGAAMRTWVDTKQDGPLVGWDPLP